MQIFLTGGSGDLGKVLACQLHEKNDTAVRFDIVKPADSLGEYIEGSILDRTSLLNNLPTTDCIVHIAAWHGYHEFTHQKDAYEFWDLNVTGTFNIFQAAVECGVKNIVLISTESVTQHNSIYGWTKLLSEKVAEDFFVNHQLNVITLRPRAFIPHWNKKVYPSYIDWAKWYWKGAVHINDVAQAVTKAIDLLSSTSLKNHLILPVDGAYEYTLADLENWDEEGVGTTFKKYYAKYYDMVVNLGFDPSLKPTIQDISETQKYLNYHPQYSLMKLLEELKTMIDNGSLN